MSESSSLSKRDHNPSSSPKVDIFARPRVKDLAIEAENVDDEKEHAFVESPVPSSHDKPRVSKQPIQKSIAKEGSVYDPQYFAVNELSDEHQGKDYLREFLSTMFPGNISFQDDRGIGLIFTATSLLVSVFMFSIMSTFYLNPSNWRFWFGVSRLALFHLCDFFMTARNQPDLVTYKSFFLFHPLMHSQRMLFMMEYWVWRVFAPQYVNGKLATTIALVSCLGCIAGQVLRVAAMWQLKDGFTYCLAQKKRQNHELKTDGLYQYVRHPSYSGAFLLFVCTAIVFCAPLSLLYTMWMGRSTITHRCQKEEELLEKMFSKDYTAYKQRVPWRMIPGVY